MSTSTKLNRRERRAQQLLAHYTRCEALARHLGHPSPDGKKISVALFKLETACHKAAEAYCNGEIGHETFDVIKYHMTQGVREVLYGRLPPGFFVNSDPRGYALKIDDQSPIRDFLLEIGMQRDMGGYFILSPEITGD